MALFVLPLVTAGLTAFYMFRLWYLAFAGEPRDHHVADHAHESPGLMTVPLIVLAVFSVGVAWGWPAWDPHASALAHLLEPAMPAMAKDLAREDHAAGWLALAAAAVGFAMATLIYAARKIDAAALKARAGGAYVFLRDKWYFDELYDVLFVRPAIVLGFGSARFDKRSVPAEQADQADRAVNVTSLDGVLNALGLGTLAVGRKAQEAQSGLIRRYVAILMLAAVALLTLLVVGWLWT